MKLYVDRNKLGATLARIQSVVEKRSTQPILANVLVHAREGQLRLSATDTEVAYIGRIDANVELPGEIAVDADAFFKIVRKLPESVVSLVLSDNQRLVVSSGRAVFALNGLPAIDFPAIPTLETDVQGTLSTEDFARIVRQTKFCIPSEDVRWGINGAKFEPASSEQGTLLRIVTTDSHRLAVSEAAYQGQPNFPERMLIPRKALNVLGGLLDTGDGPVQLAFSDNALEMRRESDVFWFRLLDGEFPDYKQVIGGPKPTRITFRLADLNASLERVRVLLGNDKTSPVRFEIDQGEAKLSASSIDRGSFSESQRVEQEGPGITIGFNPVYLLEVLHVLTGDDLVMELDHPLSAVRVADPARSDAFFVVMPMRLSD